MKIKLARKAAKALSRLDSATKGRITHGIRGIPGGNIKKLRGHSALYRLRIGDWRIVFSYPDDDTILIEDIAPRGQIYKGV